MIGASAACTNFSLYQLLNICSFPSSTTTFFLHSFVVQEVFPLNE